MAILQQLAMLADSRGEARRAIVYARQAVAVERSHAFGATTDPRTSPSLLLAAYLRKAGDVVGVDDVLASIGYKERMWTSKAFAGSGIALEPTEPTELQRSCTSSGSHGIVSDKAKVVGEMKPKLQSCYREALPADRTAQTSIQLTAHIGARGDVMQVRALAGLKVSDALIQCVIGVISSAKFDPPHGGATTIGIPLIMWAVDSVD